MHGLSERHRELKHQRKQIAEKMEAIAKEDTDDKPMDDAQSTTFDELASALAAIDQRLQRVAAAMQAAAEGATDGEGEDGDGEGDDDDKSLRRGGVRLRTGGAARAKRDPDAGLKDKRGVKAARYVLGLMHASFNRVSLDKAAEFISNRFGDDVVARALTAGITGEGGALIPQDFMADLIELLRAMTAVRGASPMEAGCPWAI